MKEKLIAVVGPTATGKTKVSLALAKTLDGEIINGDAMQVYRGMDIGTAKIAKREMQGIPHHLLDIKEPTESYSVSEFQKLAKSLVTDTHRKKRIPIVVGGTGLYIKALTHAFHFSETSSDPDFRKEMEAFVQEKGAHALFDRLQKVDPASAKKIHPHNIRRVIRALEIFHITNVPASENRGQIEDSPYHLVVVGLTMERENLYCKINQRVDQMIADGLIDEVRRLFDAGVRDCQSIQAIGYKEIYAYLQGEQSQEDAITQLKQNSRHYAKRQLTWFRRQMDVQWFDIGTSDFEKKVMDILQFVEGKL